LGGGGAGGSAAPAGGWTSYSPAAGTGAARPGAARLHSENGFGSSSIVPGTPAAPVASPPAVAA
jgi:hypothetical protein